VRNAGIGISLTGNGATASASDISANRATGIAVTSGLTGIVISGSNIFGNIGSGITAGTAASPTVTATGNWWGSAAGPPGTNGAANVGNVNAASPAVALLVLSIPFP